LRSTCARRPLAVLFCDLVGSTELSERSGPEEYAYILKEYRALAIRAIEPFEAHVPEYLVDGIPVFFGFPIAHEDDTRRAILAARAIQDAIKRRNARLYVVQRPSRAQSWGEDVGRAG
jgi:class 3 adenylate cyclase